MIINSRGEFPEDFPLTKGKVKESIFKCAVHYASISDISVKKAALQIMGSLFIQSPLLFVEKSTSKILKKAFEDSSPVDVKIRVLQLFSEFLIEEEKKLEKARETKQSKQLDTG
jgi:hypothetical protein